MFIRASFSINSLPLQGRVGVGLKNKKPFIHIRDEEFSPRYHPNSVERFEGFKSQVLTFNIQPFKFQTLLNAVTGIPDTDYFPHSVELHQCSRSCEQSGEFGLERSLGRWCWAFTSLSQLADGTTYYSCFDFCWGWFFTCPIQTGVKPVPALWWTQRDSNPRPSQCH